MLKRMVICLLVAGSLTVIGGDEKEKGYLGVTLGHQIVINHGDHDGHEKRGQAGDGVTISVVYDDGAADKAGLERGDRIVSVNGIEVLGGKDLTDILDDFRIGDVIEVTVDRAGELMTKAVTLGEMPAIHGIGNKWVKTFDVPRAYIGIEMKTLEDQLADYFEVAGGVLVTSVVEGDPAHAAGLRAGDVIVSLAGKPVVATSDLTQAMADLEPGATFDVEIVRKGKRRTLPVTAGERAFGDFDFEFDFRGLENLQHVMPRLEYFDSNEWQHDMEKLRKELEQLKGELKKRDH